IARLHGVPRWPCAAEPLVDQCTRAAALIAIDEDTGWIARGRGDRIDRVASLEPGVAFAKHDSLQTSVTRNQIECWREVGGVVLPGLGVEQMNAGDVAFATLGRVQSGEAADGEELRSHADLLQLAKQVIEPDAVATDDDEIRQLQFASEQLHGD